MASSVSPMFHGGPTLKQENCLNCTFDLYANVDMQLKHFELK